MVDRSASSRRMSFARSEPAKVSGDSQKLGERSKAFRTRLFLALACAAALVLVASLLFLGVHLYTGALHKAVLSSMKTRDQTHQSVYADAASALIEYRVEDGGVDAIYVDDYNSLLEVVRVSTRAAGFVCYASPMNETRMPDLSSVNATFIEAQPRVESVVFVRNRDPIPDIGFMNGRVRSMCKGVPTYWAVPLCRSSYDSAAVRKKRDKCGQVCNYLCRVIRQTWDCGDHCWIAEVGCFAFGLFGGH